MQLVTRPRLSALLLALPLSVAALAACSSSASADDGAEKVLEFGQENDPEMGYESAECEDDLAEVGDTSECTLEGENDEGAFTQTLTVEVAEKDGDQLNFEFADVTEPEYAEAE